MIKKILFLVTICLLSAFASFADTISINHFVIKENPFAQHEVAIVATDTAGTIQESVNGRFNFTINGFENELSFQNGTAFYRHKVDKSAFMYIKHKNESGTHSMLYYIYKHGEKLSPWKISVIWLVAIPLILVFIAYLFKRFIVIAAIVLILFLYFNHHNGLSIPTFFESIFDGLKGAVGW
ncbi:hypothetical protein KHS38_04070 [Mucilaginibacter sp. Bleaf8]|uniref:hypothetical protein n=1 Tax=Mucilaginibacter sp. Bleaf8 TaxID=2834430 RepID=UPI001BCCD758|nr:hypothetical protein [Mucilaginibacter sp. Bleaf8]MBS7563574.1 hypothetical protein [Mucilaginibacter sp. Bleaf8]